MARLFRDYGLSLVLAALFPALLGGQSVAGMHQYSEEQEAHGEPAVSYAACLPPPHFGEAVLSAWLRGDGSSEPTAVWKTHRVAQAA